MKAYRILERTNGRGEKWYYVQKKSIFGFWRAIKCDDYGRPTAGGWYYTLEEAEDVFRGKTTPVKTRVIKTTENQ